MRKYTSARDQQKKGAAAIKSLEKETGNSAIFLQLDLADLPSVRAAAETFLSHESRLDILFNNGGVMMCPTDQLTAQNHDLQFGTDVIGHFFFTELLLPALTKSYEETQVPARVIHTSSAGHAFAPGNGIDFVSLKGGPERDAWVNKKGNLMSRAALYGESKIGNIIISNYFAKTHSAVLVSCALPGTFEHSSGKHCNNAILSRLKHPTYLASDLCRSCDRRAPQLSIRTHPTTYQYKRSWTEIRGRTGAG
ncbi:Short-chain dehydrogenase/reductase family protein [Mycena venus]|uniref:Short-chain dehydrogenase/reductase family protein n=1 Tax=Mycena venus TaxID=2733690 RepID=A0A8H6X278_9AGAR|nr:Short-chain dehydrogenase/reductase family protein [Mycena venus]